MTKTATSHLTAAERKNRIVELRRAGYLLREIADDVGCSPQYAHKVIVTHLNALSERLAEDVARLRAQEYERLEAALKAVWPQALEGDLKATDRIIKIMERKAKLFGLDAPARQELSGREGGPLEVEGKGLASLLAAWEDMQAGE